MDDKSNHLRLGTALVVLCLLVSQCVSAQSTSASPQSAQQIISKLDEYLNTATKADRFSGSVLVAQNNNILLSKGYGLANQEQDAPNTPQTKFRIASLTKQFTALAIMILQERGKLNVSNSVCKYVRKCPAAWQQITIHHLLTHTSGIFDFDDLPENESAPDCAPYTVAQIIASFKNKPLGFKPGAKFSYSNSNYALLGFIIEKLSGESYEQFLQENIFKPLKMDNTGYDHPEIILKQRASGYVRIDGKLMNAPFVHMSGPYAAGGLYSTVEDMYLWDQALYTNKLVSKKTLEQIFSPFKDDYGYGWWIEPNLGRTSYIHSGQIDGFVCNITRFPNDKVTVIVLSNLENSRVNIIALNLAAIVLVKA